MTLIDLEDLDYNTKSRLTESESDEVAKLASIIEEEGEETDDFTPEKTQDSERGNIKSQAYTETSLMRIVIMLDQMVDLITNSSEHPKAFKMLTKSTNLKLLIQLSVTSSIRN